MGKKTYSKKNKSKRARNLCLISFALISVLICIGLYFSHKAKKELELYPAYTKGVVYDFFRQSKRSHDFRYSFMVDSVLHKASQSYNRRLSTLQIGDSVTVKYSTKDPINNIVLDIK